MQAHETHTHSRSAQPKEEPKRRPKPRHQCIWPSLADRSSFARPSRRCDHDRQFYSHRITQLRNSIEHSARQSLRLRRKRRRDQQV